MNKKKDIEPLVSVVMITYNHEQFIHEAIEGVLMQEVTFPVELIIADDCSPDNTQQIVKNIQENHENGDWINYTKHHNNKGMMPNFIWALKQAKGKYIALCEGDDYWTDPLKLQKQVDFLECNDEFVLTYHNAEVINEAGEILGDSKLPESRKRDFSRKELKQTKFILTLTMVFRNCIGGYPSNFANVYNGDIFLVSILGNYGKGKYMDEIKPAVYRVHDGGVWSKEDKLSRKLKSLNTPLELMKYYKKNKDSEMVEYFHQKLTISLNELSRQKLQKKLKRLLSSFVVKNSFQIGLRNSQYYFRKIYFK